MIVFGEVVLRFLHCWVHHFDGAWRRLATWQGEELRPRMVGGRKGQAWVCMCAEQGDGVGRFC